MIRPRSRSGAASCIEAFEFADQAVKPAPTRKRRTPAAYTLCAGREQQLRDGEDERADDHHPRRRARRATPRASAPASAPAPNTADRKPYTVPVTVQRELREHRAA